MRYSLGFVLTLCLLAATSHDAAAGDLDDARGSFREAALVSYAPDDASAARFIACSGRGANLIDVLLTQLYRSVRLPEEEVRRVMDLFDGEVWTDINYQDKSRGGWTTGLHVTRIHALAKSYAAPDSPFYKDPALGGVIHSAMRWWFANQPICPNWWHNDIGVPRNMLSAMLLIRDELDEEEYSGALKVSATSGFGRTGQNKVWLAGIQLMKGLLFDDEALVAEARRQIGEEIRVTEEEGIQSDWSYHQHGPQVQFGNYGLTFAEDVSFWVRALEGTRFAFSDGQKEIVSRLILEGIGWTVWKGFMDPNFCGRQLHIDGGRGKALALAVAAKNMAAVSDSADRETFEEIYRMCLSGDGDINRLTGARYYDRSDCGIYRTPRWYASVRMQSTRTVGFEYTNSENLLANFSADGALLVMRDGKEYENIFACWDWRKLPGVTSYENGKPIPCHKDKKDKWRRENHSSYVRGKVEGDVMLTVMEVERDSLHALKSNFFFPDAVIALGTDIRAEDPGMTRLTTALDQARYVSEPVIDRRSRWAWHNGKGYVSLDSNPVCVETAWQAGSWEMMAPCYKGLSDTLRVFKCWIEHKVASGPQSYAYAVLPDASAGETAGFAGSRGLRVLRNDTFCQAVLYKGRICAIVHRPGVYTFGKRRVEAVEPDIVVL